MKQRFLQDVRILIELIETKSSTVVFESVALNLTRTFFGGSVIISVTNINAG
jgi:hypothetical protein